MDQGQAQGWQADRGICGCRLLGGASTRRKLAARHRLRAQRDRSRHSRRRQKRGVEGKPVGKAGANRGRQLGEGSSARGRRWAASRAEQRVGRARHDPGAHGHPNKARVRAHFIISAEGVLTQKVEGIHVKEQESKGKGARGPVRQHRRTTREGEKQSGVNCDQCTSALGRAGSQRLAAPCCGALPASLALISGTGRTSLTHMYVAIAIRSSSSQRSQGAPAPPAPAPPPLPPPPPPPPAHVAQKTTRIKRSARGPARGWDCSSS